MKKILCVIPLVFLVFVSFGVAADASNFTFSVTFGPHPVGFRVVHQYDYSRMYKSAFDLDGKPVTGERARPIQTLIWYPAQPDSSAKPMLYGRYVELFATEENFDDESKRNAAAIARTLVVDTWKVKKEKFESECVQPIHAYLEAKAASGKFPVVIYASGFSGFAFAIYTPFRKRTCPRSPWRVSAGEASPISSPPCRTTASRRLFALTVPSATATNFSMRQSMWSRAD